MLPPAAAPASQPATAARVEPPASAADAAAVWPVGLAILALVAWFGMLEPFFNGFGSRMLTEFPEPVDVLGQARESVPAAEEHSDLLPKDEQDALTKQRKRNALQTQLNLAVEAERFEEAAKLRDELRALEQ